MEFVEADLFTWRPTRRYDAVFFGFWISTCLRTASSPSGTWLTPRSHRQRRLTDGTAFRGVNIPYVASELEERLSAIGWDIKASPTAGPFYWGTGSRRE